MSRDDLKKGYLKGYQDGLRAAWAEVVKLTSRGYSPMELAVWVKSKVAVLDQDVDAKRRQLEALPFGGDMPSAVDTTPPVQPGPYLVPEDKAEAIFEVFGKMLAAGYRGLCVSRQHPDTLQPRFGLDSALFLWLAKGDEKDKAAVPANLSALAQRVYEFLDEGGGVILLEGLEYLITQNGFPSVLKFVQSLSERVQSAKSYLLLSVNPDAFSAQEYGLLTKEAVEVY